VALFVFGLSGCSKKNNVIELKLGYSLDVEHPVHRAMIFYGRKTIIPSHLILLVVIPAKAGIQFVNELNYITNWKRIYPQIQLS
jgi:hypothetical protein